MTSTPQLDLFQRTVPTRPYCTDDPARGVQIRERMTAVKQAYIQANGPRLVRWLCYDVDRPGAGWDWEDRDVAPPNIAVENPKTHHAHLLYALGWPIPKSPELHYTKQLRYGAAVETAYRDALGADIGYTGNLVQNPLHARWNTLLWETEVYDLPWLADYSGIDLRRYTDGRTRLPDYGLGRNCTLFADLRRWSYRAIRRYSWPEGSVWHQLVIAEASRRNEGFPTPLPLREMQGIAKSVGRWTLAHFTPEQFSAIQAARKRKDTDRRRAESERKQQRVFAFPAMSQRTIATLTGVPQSTVQWLRGSQPKTASIESIRPWEAQGISRRTWYRHKKARRGTTDQ